MLLKNQVDLAESEKVRLDAILSQSACSKIAYELKEEFREIADDKCNDPDMTFIRCRQEVFSDNLGLSKRKPRQQKHSRLSTTQKGLNIMTSTLKVESPVVQLGSQGEAVIDLQVLLNQTVAAKLSVDGIFGAKTEDAVKTTQSIFFLEIDGIVGTKTWTVLRTKEPIEMPVLKRGSKGDLVRRVQVVLKQISLYKGNLDGDFGAKTEAAVTAFQKDREGSVKQLGVIDQNTWKRLVGTALFFAID